MVSSAVGPTYKISHITIMTSIQSTCLTNGITHVDEHSATRELKTASKNDNDKAGKDTTKTSAIPITSKARFDNKTETKNDKTAIQSRSSMKPALRIKALDKILRPLLANKKLDLSDGSKTVRNVLTYNGVEAAHIFALAQTTWNRDWLTWSAKESRRLRQKSATQVEQSDSEDESQDESVDESEDEFEDREKEDLDMDQDGSEEPFEDVCTGTADDYDTFASASMPGLGPDTTQTELLEHVTQLCDQIETNRIFEQQKRLEQNTTL
jgi:hypothetical protein